MAVSTCNDLTEVKPARLARIALTYTNRCNLRCIYCPEGTHAPEYYADASPEHLTRMLAFVREHCIREVRLGFYGETTVFSEWVRYSKEFLGLGCELFGTFNFARILTEEELAVICCFNTITVSIDTPDPAVLKEIRNSVDVRTILYNMQLVRSYCVANGMRIPAIQWSSLLFDRVVHHASRLVAFAAANGVNCVDFQTIATYANLPRVYRNIYELEGEELLGALRCIVEAVNLASTYNVKCVIAGFEQIQNVVEMQSRGAMVSFDVNEAVGIPGVSYEIKELTSQPLQQGQTRQCVVPWTETFVDQSGNVFPCSQLGTVMGRVTEQTSLADVLNSKAYQSFRQSLLTGDLGIGCAHCATKQIASVSGLKDCVASITRVC